MDQAALYNCVGGFNVASKFGKGPIMLRQSTEIALENVAYFNTLCIKDIRKTKSGPERIEDPQLFNIRGLSGP